MQSATSSHLTALARACVDSMGDVFWDYDADRHAALGFNEPRQTAIDAVTTALEHLASNPDSTPAYTCALRLEYQAIVSRVGVDARDDRLIAALIEGAAWTDAGARTLEQLARTYGSSILRNALALAEALNIEDGSARL